MEQQDYYVKTYDLNSGEISIGNILHRVDTDLDVHCWRGVNEFHYEGADWIEIEPNTLIWDKSDRRYVFAYGEDMKSGHACFSTIVIDTSEWLETLLVNDEQVVFKFKGLR